MAFYLEIQMNPKDIAKLITEDPDIPATPPTPTPAQPRQRGSRRSKNGWQAEIDYTADELENPKLFGNLMFAVECVIGASVSPAEPMVRYYPDGSGYPGSPGDIEWDITEIKDFAAYDENGDEVALEPSPELIEKLKEAVRQTLDDDRVNELVFGDSSSDYDDRYDRRREDY